MSKEDVENCVQGFGPIEKRFKKYDGEKPSFDMVCDLAHELGMVNSCMQYGARKYDRDNWKLGSSMGDLARYKSAAVRHVLASLAGEHLDSESGLPHMVHAATNVLFVIHLERLNKEKEARHVS